MALNPTFDNGNGISAAPPPLPSPRKAFGGAMDDSDTDGSPAKGPPPSSAAESRRDGNKSYVLLTGRLCKPSGMTGCLVCSSAWAPRTFTARANTAEEGELLIAQTSTSGSGSTYMRHLLEAKVEEQAVQKTTGTGTGTGDDKGDADAAAAAAAAAAASQTAISAGPGALFRVLRALATSNNDPAVAAAIAAAKAEEKQKSTESMTVQDGSGNVLTAKTTIEQRLLVAGSSACSPASEKPPTQQVTYGHKRGARVPEGAWLADHFRPTDETKSGVLSLVQPKGVIPTRQTKDEFVFIGRTPGEARIITLACNALDLRGQLDKPLIALVDLLLATTDRPRTLEPALVTCHGALNHSVHGSERTFRLNKLFEGLPSYKDRMPAKLYLYYQASHHRWVIGSSKNHSDGDRTGCCGPLMRDPHRGVVAVNHHDVKNLSDLRGIWRISEGTFSNSFKPEPAMYLTTRTNVEPKFDQILRAITELSKDESAVEALLRSRENVLGQIVSRLDWQASATGALHTDNLSIIDALLAEYKYVPSNKFITEAMVSQVVPELLRQWGKAVLVDYKSASPTIEVVNPAVTGISAQAKVLREQIAGFYDLFNDEEHGFRYAKSINVTNKRPNAFLAAYLPDEHLTQCFIIYNASARRWEIVRERAKKFGEEPAALTGITSTTGTGTANMKVASRQLSPGDAHAYNPPHLTKGADLEVLAFLESSSPSLETGYGVWWVMDPEEQIYNRTPYVKVRPFVPGKDEQKPYTSIYEASARHIKEVTPRLIRILFKTETFASAVVGQRDIIVGMLEHTLRAVKSDRRRLTFAKLPENRPQKSTLPHLLLLLSRLQEVSGNDPAVKNFFRQDNGRIVMLLVDIFLAGTMEADRETPVKEMEDYTDMLLGKSQTVKDPIKAERVFELGVSAWSAKRLLELPLKMYGRELSKARDASSTMRTKALDELRMKMESSVIRRLVKLCVSDSAYLQLLDRFLQEQPALEKSLLPGSSKIVLGVRQTEQTMHTEDMPNESNDEQVRGPCEEPPVPLDDMDPTKGRYSLFFGQMATLCKFPEPARILLEDPATFRHFFQVVLLGTRTSHNRFTEDAVMTTDDNKDDNKNVLAIRYAEVLQLCSNIAHLLIDSQNNDLLQKVFLVDPAPSLVKCLRVRTDDIMEKLAAEALSFLAAASSENCETIARNDGVSTLLLYLRRADLVGRKRATAALAALMDGSLSRQKAFIEADGIRPLIRLAGIETGAIRLMLLGVIKTIAQFLPHTEVLAESGVFALVIDILETGTVQEQIMAVLIVGELANNQLVLRQMARVHPVITTLRDAQIGRNAGDIFAKESFRPRLAALADLPMHNVAESEFIERRDNTQRFISLLESIASGGRKGHGSHIMVSYCHKNADRVRPVARRLQEKGVNIWIDTWGENMPGRMAGNMVDKMAEGVEGSAVVLVFMSPEYQHSQNCKMECQYAHKLSKPIVPINVNAGPNDGDWKPEESGGWLAIILGNDLWYPLPSTKPSDIQTCANAILMSPAMSGRASGPSRAPPRPAAAPPTSGSFGFEDGDE